MIAMNRRGFFGLSGLLALLGARRAAAMQEGESQFIAVSDTVTSVGPGTHPQLYFEAVYRCPKGHESIRYVMKEFFNMARDSRDLLDPTKPATSGDHCDQCHWEWIRRQFPARQFVDVREVDEQKARRRDAAPFTVIWSIALLLMLGSTASAQQTVLNADAVESTTATISGLTSGRVVITGSGGLLATDSDLTFLTDTLTSTKVAISSLTSTRVPFASTAGLLVDSSVFTFTSNTFLNVPVVVTTTGVTAPLITAAANLILNPTGDLYLDPVGNDVLPVTNYDINLGALSLKYLTLHAAELWVETLVAQNTIATIGGRILVGPTTTLTFDMAPADTVINVKHNQIAVGDRVYLEADGKVEFMAVTSGPSGSGPYQYGITRNLDGTGANQWYAGDAVFNTGTTGKGFIDLYSVSGVLSGAGPTITFNRRTGTAYNAIETAGSIGNLNGTFGYATEIYGAAFGSPTAAWIKIDPTNGVRIGHNATTLTQIDASGNASFTGTITAGAGTIGGFTIGSTDLFAGTGATRVVMSSAGTDAFYAGNNTPASAPFRVTSAGALTASSGTIGGWTINPGFIFSGSGSTQVTLDAAAATGYSISAGGLGGTAPFRVTPAGALTATSATITGAITATSGSFTGTITAATGTIGGWTIGSNFIYDAAGVVGMSSAVTGGDDIRFWAGNGTLGSAPFRVTESGALFASNANISGTINAASGTVTLDGNGITLSSGSSATNQVKWSDSSAISSQSGSMVVNATSSILLQAASSIAAWNGNSFTNAGAKDLGTTGSRWGNLYIGNIFASGLAGSGNRSVCVNSSGDVYAGSPTC